MVEEGWGEDSDLIELPDGRWVKPHELDEVEGEGGGLRMRRSVLSMLSLRVSKV